jgi:peptidoglycan/LPS O-acetylase OafA/YrhL
MRVESFASGRLGVDIFFCLSGLLMAKLLYVKRTPLKIFYERRITRIVPVFLLYLVTMYWLAFLIGKRVDVLEMVSTLTFFRTYYPLVPNIWENFTVPSGHLWSLNVEEHCYIFMSLLTLIAFLRKREGIALIWVGIMSIMMTSIYSSNPATAPFNFEIRTECAASFLVISAGYSLIKAEYNLLVSPVVPVISLILAVCCYFKWFPSWGVANLAPFLLSFTANHLSEAHEGMIRLLCWLPLRLLGHWSYSIYLWQQPFYLRKSSMYPGAPLVLAIAVGAASFYLFENPTRQWLNERKYLVLMERYGVIKVAKPT